jgi:hypothetical protein
VEFTLHSDQLRSVAGMNNLPLRVQDKAHTTGFFMISSKKIKYVSGWVDGWMNVKANLRIAYNNHLCI